VPGTPQTQPELLRRRREVIRRARAGESNERIARDLGVSYATVCRDRQICRSWRAPDDEEDVPIRPWMRAYLAAFDRYLKDGLPTDRQAMKDALPAVPSTHPERRG
jgi:hypothetical protein